MAEKNIIIQKEKSLVNAVYKLTLDEQRLFHYSIAKVNPFKYRNGLMYEIAITEVINFYGINASDAYKHLYNALHKLFNRQCRYYDENKKTWVTTHLVTRITDNKKGIIGVSFTDEIREMISDNKDFLAYKLAQTVNITSPNANRLYELLLYPLQRCPINKLMKNINIEELKELMGLTKNYPRFTDFKKYVLEVSRVQINKHTDITISYTVVKKGRTPHELKFIAKYKNNREEAAEELVEDQAEIPNLDNPEKVENKSHASEMSEEQKAKLRSEFKNILNS